MPRVKLIDRYLIREFLIPLCYCLAAFMLIYVIYDLSAHLDNYIEDRVPMRFLFHYYMIQMPLVMVQVIPLSILLAIVYCVGALSRHNEITAMRATGITVYRIMLPYLCLGACFTGVIFYLNERHAPRAYEESKKFLEDASGRRDEEKGKMRPLAFFNSKEGRSWAGQWGGGAPGRLRAELPERPGGGDDLRGEGLLPRPGVVVLRRFHPALRLEGARPRERGDVRQAPLPVRRETRGFPEQPEGVGFHEHRRALAEHGPLSEGLRDLRQEARGSPLQDRISVRRHHDRPHRAAAVDILHPRRGRRAGPEHRPASPTTWWGW